MYIFVAQKGLWKSLRRDIPHRPSLAASSTWPTKLRCMLLTYSMNYTNELTLNKYILIHLLQLWNGYFCYLLCNHTCIYYLLCIYSLKRENKNDWWQSNDQKKKKNRRRRRRSKHLVCFTLFSFLKFYTQKSRMLLLGAKRPIRNSTYTSLKYI